LATDAFMQAVGQDAPWELHFGGPGDAKTVATVLPARELWDKIMRATYAYAEPGVIFIDRINRRNNLWYCEQIHATNPCGEQPLPPYGACLLGSLNLARFVEDPFTPQARLDTAALAGLVPDAVRLMDNIIDISGFPLQQQQEEATKKRRIGLGVTGLAAALLVCCVSGLEPVFSLQDWSSVLMADGSRCGGGVTDYGLRAFRRLTGAAARLPDYFVDAQTLSREDDVVVQPAVERYFGSGIANTI